MGGIRSPSSLEQQSATESSSFHDLSTEGVFFVRYPGAVPTPARSLGEISPGAAGITWLLLSKDRAAREVKGTAQGPTGKGFALANATRGTPGAWAVFSQA
jgi:hypothetical protein